ncbi:MAG: hypothetical protein LBO20_02395 [Bifidobacteriaceae bacterium]|nr:hypothetical protein [Bifidobacteriaceae bacterium]
MRHRSRPLFSAIARLVAAAVSGGPEGRPLTPSPRPWSDRLDRALDTMSLDAPALAALARDSARPVMSAKQAAGPL